MDKELKSEDLAKVAGGTLPELPATTLEDSAYSNMFAPCEPLVPEQGLPGFQPDTPVATFPDRYNVDLTIELLP